MLYVHSIAHRDIYYNFEQTERRVGFYQQHKNDVLFSRSGNPSYIQELVLLLKRVVEYFNSKEKSYIRLTFGLKIQLIMKVQPLKIAAAIHTLLALQQRTSIILDHKARSQFLDAYRKY